MDTVATLLYLAIMLLQAVIANPSDPANAQRIHFAQEAFELSQNYSQITIDAPQISEPNPAIAIQQIEPVSSGAAEAAVVPVPNFISPATASRNGNSVQIIWSTDIPAAAVIYACSGQAQIEQLNSGNPKGCAIQGSVSTTTDGSFVWQIGAQNSPFAVVVDANGQENYSKGIIPQM